MRTSKDQEHSVDIIVGRRYLRSFAFRPTSLEHGLLYRAGKAQSRNGDENGLLVLFGPDEERNVAKVVQTYRNMTNDLHGRRFLLCVCFRCHGVGSILLVVTGVIFDDAFQVIVEYNPLRRNERKA